MSCSLANCGSIARERDHVEREVPGGVPRVLPLVGHRDDVAVEQVRPVAVAARRARLGGGGGWPGSPSSQSFDDVVVELLASRAARRTPAATTLPLLGVERRRRAARRRTRRPRAMRCVEDRVELRGRTASSAPRRSAQRRSRSVDLAAAPGRRARSARRPSCRVRSGFTASRRPCDHVLVERVLHVAASRFGTPKSRCDVRLVLGEEQLGRRRRPAARRAEQEPARASACSARDRAVADLRAARGFGQ